MMATTMKNMKVRDIEYYQMFQLTDCEVDAEELLEELIDLDEDDEEEETEDGDDEGPAVDLLELLRGAATTEGGENTQVGADQPREIRGTTPLHRMHTYFSHHSQQSHKLSCSSYLSRLEQAA